MLNVRFLNRQKSICLTMRPQDILEPEEFQAMLNACRDGRERAIIMLLGGVGLRDGETSQLLVKDIDFKGGWIKLRPEITKFRKYRSVYVPTPVLETLKAYIEGNFMRTSMNKRYKSDVPIYELPKCDGYLFPGYSGRHISTRQIQNIVIEVAELAGVQRIVATQKNGKPQYRVHPHMLRHSFAVWSLQDLIPLYDLRDQLGHSNIATTSIYLTVTPEQRRRAYERSGFAHRFETH